MKKLRIVFTFLAFAFAIAGAAMTANGSQNLLDTYGYFDGQCVNGDLMQEGCSSNGLYTCTVWIEDVGPVSAYQLQQSTGSCAILYKRWDF